MHTRDIILAVVIVLILALIAYFARYGMGAGGYTWYQQSYTPVQQQPVYTVPVQNQPVVVVPGNTTARTCYVGGCSSQLCSDTPNMVSTCEYRASYGCYQGAKCERQATGQCGWTQTVALTQCLANAQ